MRPHFFVTTARGQHTVLASQDLQVFVGESQTNSTYIAARIA